MELQQCIVAIIEKANAYKRIKNSLKKCLQSSIRSASIAFAVKREANTTEIEVIRSYKYLKKSA